MNPGLKTRMWIAAGIAIAAIAAAVVLLSGNGAETVRPLEVVGDVARALSVTGEEYEKERFSYKGNEYAGIPLGAVIEEAEPLCGDSDVLFITEDALMAEISANDLAGCYLITGPDGWEAVNTRHPVSSNMRRITSVAVASGALVTDNSLNVISDAQLLHVLTPGDLMKSGYSVGVKAGGTSSMDEGGRTLTATQYNVYKYVSLAQLADADAGPVNGVLVAGEDGGYAYDEAAGTVRIEKNSLTYVFSDGKTEMKRARGILINPPEKSVTGVKREALGALERGEKALVVILDGFGYDQFKEAKAEGLIPYLGARAAEKASTVFMPVTNAGVAAILTGEGPDKNGVWFRQKDLKAQDVFEAAAALGKKSVYVEGNKLIVKTGVAPVLNSDRNGDGNTDDEIFARIKSEMARDAADLYVVHFHAIDDAGHAGDDAKQAEMIKEADAYVRALADGFGGRVIVTADHGMHKDGAAMDHGAFLPRDMIVPYISFDGGK
jgi:hypothetical protein